MRDNEKKETTERKDTIENESTQELALRESERKDRLARVFGNILHPKKRKWLAAIAHCGWLRESERLTGIDSRFHYLWLEKDPDYPAAFEKARSIACDAAEDEIWRRAFAGFEKPLSYQGKLTGDKIREYSDLLAMFWLKGARPEKYREDSRVQINVNVPPQVNFIAPQNPEIDITGESDVD